MTDIDRDKYIAIFKTEADEYVTALNNLLLELEKDPQNQNAVKEVFRNAHNLKGAARLLDFDEIQNDAHKIEDYFDGVINGREMVNPQTLKDIFKLLDRIKQLSGQIRLPGEEDAKETAKQVEPRLPQQYIKVPVERADKFVNLVGEMVISRFRSEYKNSFFKNLIKQAKSIKGRAADPLVSSEINRLINGLNRLANEIVCEGQHLDPLIDELQTGAREIRMLPLSEIFDAYPRLVHDLASAQNKKIDFKIDGRETEIDKKALEEINPALVHLLRNAVDHGIKCSGRIELSARHTGGFVEITVKDSGGGLDLERIKAAAVKRKILTKEELEALREEEVCHLIFLPGFSTAEIITDISGRGFGMDIVKAVVDRLKGFIGIETRKDEGTKFTIKIPLTVAIVKALIVKSAGANFAVPLLSIEETIKAKIETANFIEGRMALNLRGYPLPIVYLSQVLNLGGDNPKDQFGEVSIMVFSSLGKKIGFIVDRIVKKEDIYLKSLGEHLGKVKTVEGATVLSSGEIVVVLDAAELIEEARVPKTLSGAAEEKKQPCAKKVLIVEDSLTTRELESSILSANGYEVICAQDGIEALEKISENLPDVVVTDIQMPRMDGFLLCETLKKNEKFKEIPIIIVTTLGKEEDKRRGIESGAAAYITKSSFDQRRLLDVIERVAGEAVG